MVNHNLLNLKADLINILNKGCKGKLSETIKAQNAMYVYNLLKFK